jgi:hypothetical protein
MTPEEKMQQTWNNLVRGIIAKARGIKPDEVVLERLPKGTAYICFPENETLVPVTKDSAPMVGARYFDRYKREILLPIERYVRYAIKGDYLALSKPKGRLRPHRDGGRMDVINRLSQKFFQTGLFYLYAQASIKAKETHTEIAANTPPEVAKLQQEAFLAANREYRRREEEKRKAKRKRHRISRKINFHLIPGNSNRAAHAEA